MTTATTTKPPAWAVLAHALTTKRAVSVRYHDHTRLLCPHALGWKHARATVLAYQIDGTTSHGPLPADPRQHWRTLFVDQIHEPAITDDPWQTADNYTPHTNGIDHLDLHLPA